MLVGNTNVTKEMMPSYSIGQDYPNRRYQFMQDTINGALNAQAQLQNPQNGVNVQQNAAQQPNQWSQK